MSTSWPIKDLKFLRKNMRDWALMEGKSRDYRQQLPCPDNVGKVFSVLGERQVDSSSFFQSHPENDAAFISSQEISSQEMLSQDVPSSSNNILKEPLLREFSGSGQFQGRRTK